MSTQTWLLERVETPLGQILMVVDQQGALRALDWHDYEERMHVLMRRQYPGDTVHLQETEPVSEASRAVCAYFAGDTAAVERLKVATGGTDFQREVWAALRTIPCGETLSYLALAVRIGRPKAVRAVGLANGANPISLVIPCHRIIGANQTLTGYAGGLDRKRWLLEHEGASGFTSPALSLF